MRKALFIILCFLFLFFKTDSVFAKDNKKISAKFHDCVDGDTAKFEINDEIYTARFLAIDAPEIAHGKNKADPYGEEASLYTCNALKGAKKITLEYDQNSSEVDKYDRILVWVWLDGNLLQEELVSKGYAKVAYLYADYSYTPLLQEKEEQAKEKELRIWGSKNSLELNQTGTLILTIVAILILIFLFLFNKNYRKKTIQSSKKRLKKTLEKELEKKIIS